MDEHELQLVRLANYVLRETIGTALAVAANAARLLEDSDEGTEALRALQSALTKFMRNDPSMLRLQRLADGRLDGD